MIYNQQLFRYLNKQKKMDTVLNVLNIREEDIGKCFY